MKIRPSVKWFAEQMEQTLCENDYKGGWEMCSFEYLTDRLNDEVQELNELNEDEKLDDGVTKVLARKAIRECTDVANIAMMIADNLRVFVGKE